LGINKFAKRLSNSLSAGEACCCSLKRGGFSTSPKNAKKITQTCLTILLALAISISSISAQEPAGQNERNTVFFRANNFYREKKYNEAIQEYERLVSAGIQSANIFYNLGNSYLRVGAKGKAILYYERAFRICPRDADIRSNLDFARTLVEGDSVQNIRQWYERVFFFLRSFLSTNEITFLVSALYFAVMVFLALGVYFRAQRRLFYYFAAVICALLFIVLPSLINGVYESGFQERAVVMADRTSVRFEPTDDATVHFELYEGAIIRITRSQGDWYQIKRQDGKMGWLKSSALEVI